jgi:fatty-acyl-CoA synthase
VPIDPAAATDNLYYILEQSESRGLIVADGTDSGNMLAMASAAKSDIPLLEHIISITGSSDPELVTWEEIIVGGKDVDQEALQKISNAVSPENPVAIMYTSGTTGQPKGVVLDHLGLINKSMVSAERQGISAGDKLCLFFPLFHLFGNTSIALAGLLKGAALIMPCRSFDPAKILAAIPGEKCTALYGSPSMLIALGIDATDRGRHQGIGYYRGLRHHRNLLLDHHDPSG